MQVASTLAQMREISTKANREGKRIVFVPTLGGLHEGHAHCMRTARPHGDILVASIFLNPLQFDNPTDLEKYPAVLAEDLVLCEKNGVDVVFTPSRDEMYPDGYATVVEVTGELTNKMLGVTRPGHFRGVATVVTKLLCMVRPQVAVFGEKDLQQLLIIQRLVTDLHLDCELIPATCVRETDGLAMSSRNRRLSPKAREVALSLPRGLEAARQLFENGERESMRLMSIACEEILSNPGVDVDYADVVRPRGFLEVEQAERGDVLFAACIVDGIRLIDHIHLGGPAIIVAEKEK